MGLLSTMRAVPGQLGGGLGRVVEVRALPGNRTTTGGLQSVEVVLEKAAAQPISFAESLSQFSGEQNAQATQIPLSTSVVTTVQQYTATNTTAPGTPANGKPPAGQNTQDSADTEANNTKKNSTAGATDEGEEADLPALAPNEADKLTADFLKELLPALGEIEKPDNIAIPVPSLTSSNVPSSVVASTGDLFSRMRLAASAYAGLVATGNDTQATA